MAATGTPTPNIGLRIPQGTDPASVDDINYNSNLLDTKLGAVGNTSVQDQIDSLNSKIVIEHKTSSQFTVSASSWSAQYINIAKTGYTAKMVSVVTTTNTQCVLIGAGIQSTNPSNAMITVKNVSGSDQQCPLEIDVLYMKE